MSEVRSPLRLGFARGTSPNKWAERWERATRSALELVPLEVPFGLDPAADIDVMLERTAPEERPVGTADPRTRHAVRLYEEAVVVVVPAGHELAGYESAGLDELALVGLLDHADHPSAWPDPEPWTDPSWKPADPAAALQIVATGAGAILLPLPLARHLSRKREYVVIPVDEAAGLPGTDVWASWDVERDADDVQHLVGIMRGRTARSSR